MTKKEYVGKIINNIRTLINLKENDYEYILNLKTNELHSVKPKILGMCNIGYANLDEFIAIKNVGNVPIHTLNDGELIPIIDESTCNLIVEYSLNKCKHCYPDSK